MNAKKCRTGIYVFHVALIYALFTLIMSGHILAQDLSGLPGQWVIFNRDDGLPASEVFSVWEAPDGTLWAGTAKGVAHFDGIEWQNFASMPQALKEKVLAVWGRNSQQIWAAGDEGLAVYDGQVWQQIPFETIGLVEGALHTLWGDDRGHLWVGGRTGAARFDGAAWTAFTSYNSALPDAWVQAITGRPDGSFVWFGTGHGPVCYAPGEDRWLELHAEAIDLSTFSVYSLRLTEDMLLVGTWGGLLRHDLTTGGWTRVDGSVWDGPDDVTGIWEHEGEIWLAASMPNIMMPETFQVLKRRNPGGVRHFDGERWSRFQLKDVTDALKVYDIWSDGKGIFWFATEKGLYRFDSERWRSYPTVLAETDESGIRGEIHDLWAAADGLWATGQGRIHHLHNGRWQTFTTADGIPSGWLKAVWSDGKGNAWAGGTGEMAFFDSHQWRKILSDIEFGQVYDIWGDHTNSVWMAGNRGVFHYDGTHWQPMAPDNAPPAFSDALSLTGDGQNGVWVGTRAGLWHYDGQTWNQENNPNLPEESLCPIWNICQAANGTTFLATCEGVSGLGGPPHSIGRLKFGSATAVLVDLAGTLWFNNSDEVYRIDQVPPQTILSAKVMVMAEDVNGDIWFGTDNGLLRYRPRPPVVEVGNVAMADGQAGQIKDQQILLPYVPGTVTFTLAAMDMANSGSGISFWYRLEPKDQGWQQYPYLPANHKRRQIPYEGLIGVKPQEYVLHFAAYNTTGDTIGRQSRKILTTSAPFWIQLREHTAFPWILGVGVLLSLAAGGAGLRVWQARRAYGYKDAEIVVHSAEGTYNITWQETKKRSISYTSSLQPATMAPFLEKLQNNRTSGGFQAPGSSLFNTLFNKDTEEKLRQGTRLGRKGWRLRLNLTETPELSVMPWEFTYGGSALNFLSVNPDTALVRYFPSKEDIQRPKTKLPLDILLVWAEPRDLASIGAKEEVAKIQEMLTEIDPKKKRLILHLLPQATIEQFTQRIRDKGADVVHFIGHGNVEAGKGVLYFEDEHRDNVPLKEHELANIIRRSDAAGGKTPTLVMLNACRSAESAAKGQAALTGLVPILLEQGKVPAVIGNQYPLSGEVAARFASHFYHALLSHGGGQVDYAISVARQSLFTECGPESRDWGTPVLYMQVPDGHIFDIR